MEAVGEKSFPCCKFTIQQEKEIYSKASCYLERKYKIAQRSFNSPITLENVMKNA